MTFQNDVEAQQLDLFSPLTDKHLTIPGTDFYFLPPDPGSGFRQLDPVGRVYGTPDGASLIVFEQSTGDDPGSMVWDLLGLLQEKEISVGYAEEVQAPGIQGQFMIRASGLKDSEMVAWTLELISAEAKAVAVGICPSELRDSLESVFTGVFASLRYAASDTTDVFAGWPILIDMSEFGYEMTTPLMPGSLTFAPAGVPPGEFPEQVFIFGRPEPQEVDHFNAVKDTLSATETRQIERGKTWIKLTEWERDQHGAVDRMEFTVYMVCNGVHIGAFGMGVYSEELLMHFRQIAAELKCR